MSRTFLDRLLGSGFSNCFFFWGLEGSYQRQKQWGIKEPAVACYCMLYSKASLGDCYHCTQTENAWNILQLKNKAVGIVCALITENLSWMNTECWQRLLALFIAKVRVDFFALTFNKNYINVITKISLGIHHCAMSYLTSMWSEEYTLSCIQKPIFFNTCQINASNNLNNAQLQIWGCWLTKTSIFPSVLSETLF